MALLKKFNAIGAIFLWFCALKNQMHLLVIEDDVDIQTYIKAGLQQAGFDVDVASDGKDGLMLAKADPPADSGGRGTLLLARTDALLEAGALDQAAALLDDAGSLQPELFRRRFDIALLTGTEDLGCVQMRENPQLAPTFPARIFCLARSGDWNAAALTLRTAQALGFVTPEEDALLSRFLDPELDDGDFPLSRPAKPTPLVWRMLEAVGEPLPTNTLPLAFAQAELRDTAGWKSQIEAAERLARTGAVDPDRLLGLYMDRKPAASGGVWDRVAGVQALDAALAAQDVQAVAGVLPGGRPSPLPRLSTQASRRAHRRFGCRWR
jgi:CheY-like chemotaxis protein